MTQESCSNCSIDLPDGEQRYRLFGKVFCAPCRETKQIFKDRLSREKRQALLGILLSLEKGELEEAKHLIEDLLYSIGRVS